MATLRLAWQSLRSRPALISAGAVIGFGTYYSTRFMSTGHAESAQKPKVFGEFGPKTLRLQSVDQVNHNTKRLVFEFPDKNATSGLTLTSALLTYSWPQGRWLPVLRPYTPISKLDQEGSIELMVKHYPNGKASTHLHSLAPGDTLTFMAALKGYAWTPNKFSQVYLIAGGAGITPIYQLVQGILDNPEDKTKVNLIFGVNTEQDLLLRDELEKYRQQFPDRFDYVYTVSHSQEEGSNIRKGYVTEELLKDVVKGPRQDTHVFVCGPPGMEDSLIGSRNELGILGRLGLGKEQVYRF
ncbi:ferredoxin reductase-like protein [Penicillium argentinense]|uniref:NADH-cytochrome b5 reductase n=1 Tax=Penicillium argentinense TaxID=1131581 RepID=A0A9W9FF75_9EURO|nr:ferredoxin reductase-like protein [Penicillium argentinense]KAJ5099072.1 ferredoxin reductase-like protein [Penicillium argentinense]